MPSRSANRDSSSESRRMPSLVRGSPELLVPHTAHARLTNWPRHGACFHTSCWSRQLADFGRRIAVPIAAAIVRFLSNATREIESCCGYRSFLWHWRCRLL